MATTPTERAPHRARGRVRRSSTRVVGAGLTAVALVAGTMACVNDAASAAPSTGSTVGAAARVDRTLDGMAKLLARAVTDRSLRQQIHDGVAQRFDGDTDVLYKNLAATSKVRQALASAYGRQKAVSSNGALHAVDRMAAAVPRFQIAVPARFDAWRPASFTPLVASMPSGVEDTTLETITAYDANGRAHLLNAQVAPARPVIILSQNERTDGTGRLLQSQFSVAQPTSAKSTYQVRMSKVHLLRDNEPWPKGSAEVSLRAQGGGTSYTDIDWSSLNNDEDWWIGPRELGNTTGDVIFYWWEDDGSSFDFTLSYKGVSLGVHMDDGDDLFGGIQLSHSTFEGTSDHESDWSDLEQWTD